MDTYTLELRQKNAINVNSNGDYESIVQEKILLEEGDSVIMKSVFIDTQASSNQKINVPKDLTLSFQWINYIQWTAGTGTFNNAGIAVNPISGDAGFNYILPSSQLYSEMIMKKGDVADYDFITQLFFNTLDSKGGGTSKPFDLTITYTNTSDEVVNRKVSIPAFQNQIAPQGIPNVVILYKRTEGLKFTPSNLTPFGVKLDTKLFEVPADHIVGEPELYTTTLTLEQGAYSPVDLCNAINKGLTTQKDKSGANPLYGNQFLQVQPSGSNFMVCLTPGQLEREAYANVFQPTLTPIAGHTAGKPLLVGADQIELSFSDSTQKFQWNQIHMSVFDTNGAPCVSYNPTGQVITKAGGVFWTHLGATDANGQYFDFWNNLLGFDLTKIYPVQSLNIIPSVYWAPSAGDFYIAAPSFNLVNGQNTTEGLSTIGALVPTSKEAQAAAGSYTNPLAGKAVLNPTNGKNTAIEATTSTFQQADRFGYFLIEINAKFMGKYVQKDQMKNNIRAIVGRFYELNSYTSGSQADSLVYTHIGSPMFLESYRCRILDSEQNLAPNLGEDNTIFLQVVKNPKNVLPQTEQKK